MICVKVFWWWHVSSSLVAFHFGHNPADGVLRVPEMHQLALIRGLKNGVTNRFAMG